MLVRSQLNRSVQLRVEGGGCRGSWLSDDSGDIDSVQIVCASSRCAGAGRTSRYKHVIEESWRVLESTATQIAT